MNAMYSDFRQFYNQTIHPELLNLERRRRRLVRLLSFSALLTALAIVLVIYIQIFVVTLIVLIPIGFWLAYLAFRIQLYYQEFKPRIVELILDFIDNDVNYSQLKYFPKGKIPKDKFLAGKIFVRADDYGGEDMVTGLVRETPFQLSELRVLEFSPVRSQMNKVFSGIFVVADYLNLDLKGSMLVLPDENMKYLNRTEKAFHLMGGRRQHGKALPEFETWFNTYATADMRLQDVLSEDFQRTLLDFRQTYQQQNRRKEIYLSLIGDNLYIAIDQDRDLLEPSLWSSNVSFGVVKSFYDDLSVLLALILEVDVMN